MWIKYQNGTIVTGVGRPSQRFMPNILSTILQLVSHSWTTSRRYLRGVTIGLFKVAAAPNAAHFGMAAGRGRGRGRPSTVHDWSGTGELQGAYLVLAGSKPRLVNPAKEVQRLPISRHEWPTLAAKHLNLTETALPAELLAALNKKVESERADERSRGCSRSRSRSPSHRRGPAAHRQPHQEQQPATSAAVSAATDLFGNPNELLELVEAEMMEKVQLRSSKRALLG